ncbi:MAG: hypothetical protein K0R65_1088 [Crocinitomicaceae bacterium]|jgi:hypothetical protein|nr:hypothetical protein [Crocinitomicaceae bacterium]
MTLNDRLDPGYLEAKSELSCVLTLPYASQFPLEEPQDASTSVNNAPIKVKVTSFFMVLLVY